jgi:hypothetical protein
MRFLSRYFRGSRLLHSVLLAVVAGLLAAGATAVAQGAGDPSVQQPGPQHEDQSAACPSGDAAPSYTVYDLGPSFAGLPRTDTSQLCSQPPPTVLIHHRGQGDGAMSDGSSRDAGDGRDNAGGGQDARPAGVPYTSVLYGDCQAQDDQGCPLPLEIQSWPECGRNGGMYGDSAADNALNPSDALQLASAPSIPALSFEGGTRIELYTGQTTIVVFAGDPSLALQAADALAQQAAANSEMPAGELSAKANDTAPSCGSGAL